MIGYNEKIFYEEASFRLNGVVIGYGVPSWRVDRTVEGAKMRMRSLRSRKEQLWGRRRVLMVGVVMLGEGWRKCLL